VLERIRKCLYAASSRKELFCMSDRPSINQLLPRTAASADGGWICHGWTAAPRQGHVNLMYCKTR
jgi:hypothetical protein